MNNLKTIKSRRSQVQPSGRFDNLLNDTITELEKGPNPKTAYNARGVLSQKFDSGVGSVTSSDILGDYLLNPYEVLDERQSASPYWGISPSIDAESKIIIKENAAELLRKKLSSASWKVSPIILSGNTDCYLPIEEKLELTRSILEVLWEFRHPTQITTKNALILRDLDVLKKLASHNLVKVTISLNTLDDRLRQKMNPRTSSTFSRLRTIKHLSSEGIPVSVLAAPIIPGLNDHEIMPLVRTVASHGADDINHIIIRLTDETEDDFRDWLQKSYPRKYDEVMNRIASLHTSKETGNRFGQRMIGTGSFADSIREQMRLAKKVYFNEIKKFELDTELFESIKNPQLTLFG